MEIKEAIRARKSIRGYKSESVPRAILTEILETATRAPSAMNTQPWEIAVITGKTLDDLRQASVKNLTSGVPPESYALRKPFDGVYRQRQVDLAVQLFGLTGIAREDKDKRAQWMERGFRFFDAPAAIMISIDTSLGVDPSLLDIGALCQSICLTALQYGLGTCIENQMYTEATREILGIPESKRIVIAIAIGYPDWDFPANKVESNREPLQNVTTWYGFD
ncbi:MAG: nitroreductase [Chloroflexi bacterium]|nr:nitroreductase [Chloroflexota bacterium]MBM3154283.1 nitroreductase [Chloroflexota bacterium]MBM3172610.1 nitroreductase [Chloroflexota bacterium]MBM3174614.1 nitroreductase [Chloroflexota bacterium]MBM4449543.1 nitroreductase [Chloroflexota bacterium]